MMLAFGGSSIDGPAYTDVVDLARDSPSWLDSAAAAWSTYGLVLFAVLMAVGWWRARRVGAEASIVALAVPLVAVLAFVVDTGLKSLVQEDRPCRGAHVKTLEACPAPGDWSFPSNHAAIAAAAAVALLFVSRRLGAIAVTAACVMAVSRVWVGVHYPHDAVAGLMVGSMVAFLAVVALRRLPPSLAPRLTATRLRPLLVAS